jgi:hypothetical protein
MKTKSSDSDVITKRDLREITSTLAEAKALLAERRRANDAKPTRTREQILRGMIGAIDQARPPKRSQATDIDPDYIAPVAARPQNPLRAADGTAFHRAPTGMVTRPGILISFDAGIKAAAEKMRNAFRPSA